MKKSLAVCALLLAFLAPPVTLFSQSQENTQNEALSSPAEAAPEGDAAPGGRELPRTFRQINLGMNLDELKTALIKDGYFQFRGDRDVSLLPNKDQTLIDTLGFSFIKRAYFQLREGEVFIMAFTLDTALVDHYSVYTTFTKKYGEPEFIDPKQAVWVSETTRVSIERPLTVKYIDLGVFNELIDESKTRENTELRLREEFLGDF